MSQHIDPTPKQTDLNALNSKFANYSVGTFSQLKRTELDKDNSSSSLSYTVPADGWYHLVVGCTTDSDEASIKIAYSNKTILYAAYASVIFLATSPAVFPLRTVKPNLSISLFTVAKALIGAV